jgi:type II secretory pathway pseudopilin PulG
MYGRTHKAAGLTLIETTLVVATIALLVGFAVPAVRSLVGSFQSEGAVKSMISGALSSARAMAMSKQRYVGVRFQKLCTSNDPADPLKGLLDAPQYMIFVMHDPAAAPRGTDLANGFRAIEGLEPIKLPGTMGVIRGLDPRTTGTLVGPAGAPYQNDATTFSIVFAPSGRVVVHPVRVRNKDGVYQPRNDPGSTKTSYDDVFNSVDNICRYKQGMFIQDDYPGAAGLMLGEEDSVTVFWIYDAATLRTLAKGIPTELTGYLNKLQTDKPVYVSSYTGHLVSAD